MEETITTPPFRLGDEVCIDKRVANTLNLNLNSDIIYTILATRIDDNCKINDKNRHCKEFCKFNAICRSGKKMIHQLIAVGDVKEFYPASYFEKAL